MFEPDGPLRLCGRCALSADRRFALVREMLRDGVRRSLPELAEQTGLSVGEISTFISDGRLVAAPAPPPLRDLPTTTGDAGRDDA